MVAENIPVIVVRPFTTHENAIKGMQPILQRTCYSCLYKAV